MRKKTILVLAILMITVMSTQTVFAASGSGTTSGGTSGKTTINYKMTCTARVGGYTDQTQIHMKAASLNTINMSYSKLQHTSKSGKISDPASGSKTNVNSATWTTTAGSAGTAHSSCANYKASSTGFGTWTKTKISATF